MARETDGEGEASDEEVQDMVREEDENGEGESDNGAARDNYMDGVPQRNITPSKIFQYQRKYLKMD